MSQALFGLDMVDVLEARIRIRTRNTVDQTRILPCQELTKKTGAKVYHLMECFQRAGSFKVRGVENAWDALPPVQRLRGVCGASSGNHGTCMAMIAGELATVVVPEHTPDVKKRLILRNGAKLVVYGDTYDDAEWMAAKLAREEGMLNIHVSEDPYVVAGQATAVLEALWEMPNVDVVLVPAGGGGLVCGTAIAAKTLNPNIRVIGIQSHASPPWYYSFAAGGKLADVEYQPSIADGLHGGISQVNIDLARKWGVDGFVLVDEDAIEHAIYWMARENQILIEGAAAVGIAALLSGVIPDIQGKTVLNIVTGRDIDTQRLHKVLQHWEPLS